MIPDVERLGWFHAELATGLEKRLGRGFCGADRAGDDDRIEPVEPGKTLKLRPLGANRPVRDEPHGTFVGEVIEQWFDAGDRFDRVADAAAIGGRQRVGVDLLGADFLKQGLEDGRPAVIRMVATMCPEVRLAGQPLNPDRTGGRIENVRTIPVDDGQGIVEVEGHRRRDHTEGRNRADMKPPAGVRGSPQEADVQHSNTSDPLSDPPTSVGPMGFFERLGDRIDRRNTVLSIGLDPDPDRLPAHLAEYDLPRWAFNRRIIDATHEVAAAFKPNVAFYEDADGWRALQETVAYAHGKDVPVVLDAKRADIGNTARRYATLLDLGDAITVNPYLGRDAIEPFLQREDAGVFVLCRTSNPGAADVQELELAEGDPVYERVASLVDVWNRHENAGLVVGATAPEELERIRELAPTLPFLVPGVGAQGGDAEAAVTYGLADGVGLVNASRSIIFAEDGPEFASAARASATRLRNRLNEFR